MKWKASDVEEEKCKKSNIHHLTSPVCGTNSDMAKWDLGSLQRPGRSQLWDWRKTEHSGEVLKLCLK